MWHLEEDSIAKALSEGTARMPVHMILRIVGNEVREVVGTRLSGHCGPVRETGLHFVGNW